MNKETFIDSLDLPEGVSCKHYNGMNRYHFTYYDKGICSLDLNKANYTLRAREDYLIAVHAQGYTLDKNHPSVPGTIKQITYDNTDVFYRLVSYILDEDIFDINVARVPLNISYMGKICLYTCPTCKIEFKKSYRCPECGQLIKE